MWNIGILVLTFALIGYVCITGEIQPWYFLNLFVFLPLFEDFIGKLEIFFAGLLFSYYPYIFLGGWDTKAKVSDKHIIISAFLLFEVIYLLFVYFKPLSKKFFRT